MTALVDTRVIMDALASREPSFREAQELLLRGAEQRITLFVSAKSFLDTHCILKHCLNDEALVRTRLSSLLNAVMILDTAGVSCANALLSPTNDYEDAVQIETAISFGVDYIVAHDQFGFTKSPIPVRTAKEILSEMA